MFGGPAVGAKHPYFTTKHTKVTKLKCEPPYTLLKQRDIEVHQKAKAIA